MIYLLEKQEKRGLWKEPNPCFKHFKAGMPYHEFRTEYQKLLGNYSPRKEYFHKRYGGYCAYHKNKVKA